MGRQLLLPDMMPTVGGLLPLDNSPHRSMPDHRSRGKQAVAAPQQQAVGALKLLSSRSERAAQRQPVCSDLVLFVGSWLAVHEDVHMLCGGHTEHVLIGMQLMLGTWPANRTAESALLGLPLWQTTWS